MKILKCRRCGEIFFAEDGKEEKTRSFEDFCCEECAAEEAALEEALQRD